MTFKEAKDNFVIFKVYKPYKNKKGKIKYEEIEDINEVPDNALGKICVCDIALTLMPLERLGFVLERSE